MQKIRLYCITCPRKDLSYEEQVEQACLGGADAIQLRDKALSDKEVLALGQRLKDICKKHKALFIVNDRPDLALALDADGVHLGADDIPTEWARRILGGIKIVGRSASSLGQALAAADEGADYVGLGPIYATPVKPDKSANGVDIIRLVKKRVKIPVIAIGGITAANVGEVIATGADGVSVVRGVCGAASVRQAAQEMKQRILDADAARAKMKNNDAY